MISVITPLKNDSYNLTMNAAKQFHDLTDLSQLNRHVGIVAGGILNSLSENSDKPIDFFPILPAVTFSVKRVLKNHAQTKNISKREIPKLAGEIQERVRVILQSANITPLQYPELENVIAAATRTALDEITI